MPDCQQELRVSGWQTGLTLGEPSNARCSQPPTTRRQSRPPQTRESLASQFSESQAKKKQYRKKIVDKKSSSPFPLPSPRASCDSEAAASRLPLHLRPRRVIKIPFKARPSTYPRHPPIPVTNPIGARAPNPLSLLLAASSSRWDHFRFREAVYSVFRSAPSLR